MARYGHVLLSLLAAFAAAASAFDARAEYLTILYHDRAPYYQNKGDGRVSGIVATPISRALETANIRYRWLIRPGNVHLKIIESGDTKSCAAGWFKNPKRQEYARFSDPVYRDRSQIVVARTNDKAVVTHTSLHSLLLDRKLKIGTKRGYSYGPFLDGLIRDLSPQKVDSNRENSGMVQMLLGRRFDYFLAAPEEFLTLAEKLEADIKRISMVRMWDIPPGNHRYLICGKDVPQSLIDRFNSALATIKL